jgi:Flp pilus assembly pilin Flp
MVGRYLRREAEDPRQRGLQTGEYMLVLAVVAVVVIVVMVGTADQLEKQLELVAGAFAQAP